MEREGRQLRSGRVARPLGGRDSREAGEERRTKDGSGVGGVREDDGCDGGSAIVQGILPQFWLTEGSKETKRPPLRFSRRNESGGFATRKDGATQRYSYPWFFAFSVDFQTSLSQISNGGVTICFHLNLGHRLIIPALP